MTNPGQARETLIHATAIVLGRHGYLIIGPSGSGKSRLARHLLDSAAETGLFAALVADDQVSIEVKGGRLLASRPRTIAGLMEIRFSGLVKVASLETAVMDAVITPVRAQDEPERLPPSDESRRFPGDITLPVIRLHQDHLLSVASLERLHFARIPC
ncbi:HPr kinase/phosphorylase [Allorhizobium taibaishanense]|uniref:Serine kinase of HPr protein (Carbohydrate metabolism regulator) n=1 Tax=Allorhizobium taibaishanense TaxID=887144 RepID=A0A1Q9A2I6_9HYPH|nr:HPr kinase/phosphatase C-terminal domain-containing protein [Allorhizobium taibaishanense]MBB4008955.1 serine kinase of HPr protein (carbohydrate metabolism regulator) [Allorhizobium taibaishanense]OLP48723.1 hypothetical protein BJF91_01960 [Allorhizobium taibaishanense]